MQRHPKHDKRSRNRLGKAFKSNIAVHPFVMVSIAAALAVVVWVIMSFMLRYM